MITVNTIILCGLHTPISMTELHLSPMEISPIPMYFYIVSEKNKIVKLSLKNIKSGHYF